MGLRMSLQPELKQQEKKEAIVEDRREYKCTIHPWGKPPYNFCFDYLDGHPKSSPSGEKQLHIRTFLKERFFHLSNMQETHTNIVRYDFYNIPISTQAINYILFILNVPKENQASMAQQILEYTINMTYNFMIVMVDADIFYHDNDNYDGTTSMKDQACQAKPTSDNKLKGVKLEVKETWEIFKDFCGICWKELRDDAIQLPCSHFYHGNCILHWLLKKKNYCNRCYFEFEMP